VNQLAENFEGVRGEVTIITRDRDGKILEVMRSNKIVTLAHELMADWAKGGSLGHLTKLKISTGGHAPDDPTTPLSPSLSDTDLDPEELANAFSHALSAPAYGAGGTDHTRLIWTTVIDESEGNALTGDKIYTEAGLFTSDDILFSRVTFPGRTKNVGISLTCVWQIRF